MSGFDLVHNLGMKAARRLGAAHKPVLRMMRRRARRQEHLEFRRDAARTETEIARIAAHRGPILVGPWLAEVGYEVLYWIPFLRWFQDAYGVPRERLVAVSRGGLDALYRECAAGYVDIFDLVSPTTMAARNTERRADREGGGQKQSDLSPFDQELLTAAGARGGVSGAAVLHPSLLFRLFRHVWHGNLPMDLFWTHVRYASTRLLAQPSQPPSGSTLELPPAFIAARFYAGPALGSSSATRDAVRALVTQAAALAPVVLLEPQLVIDEHRDFDLTGIPGVVGLRPAMTPRTNLGMQLDVISRSSYFLGTCGGLAWLAPFLGVPTVAVYDSDALLATHLLIARQAGLAAKAAEFMPLDLRALDRTGVLAPRAGAADRVG